MTTNFICLSAILTFTVVRGKTHTWKQTYPAAKQMYQQAKEKEKHAKSMSKFGL